MDHYSDEEQSELPLSKTQRKKEVQRLQELGERLISLTDNQLSKIPLTDELAHALDEAKRIKSREGLRRHKQFIGKLMREIDTSAIEATLQEFDSTRQINTRGFHDLEQLREELIAGDNEIIGTTIARFPSVDRQKLRQLVKNAKKEKSVNELQNTSDNKHGRALFRFLRELSDAHVE